MTWTSIYAMQNKSPDDFEVNAKAYASCQITAENPPQERCNLAALCLCKAHVVAIQRNITVGKITKRICTSEPRDAADRIPSL